MPFNENFALQIKNDKFSYEMLIQVDSNHNKGKKKFEKLLVSNEY